MMVKMIKRAAPWAIAGGLVTILIADKIAQKMQTETMDVTIINLGQHQYIRNDAGFNRHSYPIITDKGTFNDCDSPSNFKFSDGKFYEQMQKDERWRVTVNGAGLFGSHRTLLGAEKLSP